MRAVFESNSAHLRGIVRNMPQFTSSQARRLGTILGIIVATNVLDQVSKVVARDHLSGQLLTYLGDTVRLQLTENTGAFLSLGADMDPTARMLIFTVGIGIFLVGTIWMLVRNSKMNQWTTISLSLIVAGGIGNLIDRAYKGSVTDFMNVGIGWLRTGVFNVADMAIMAGIFIMLIGSYYAPNPDGATGKKD
jgi:signal peptidase II